MAVRALLLCAALSLGCGVGVASASEPPLQSEEAFRFGSYGRAQMRFDKAGNSGRDTNVVAHGSRLFERSYLELDFARRFHAEDGFRSDVVITLALFDPFAHYSGIYGGEGWSLRNAYVEASPFAGGVVPGLKVWAGSRMYRGDDIYLLDTWPLDNLNTVGAGVIYDEGPVDIRVHAGVNRLEDDYQVQTVRVPDSIFGDREMVLLDRQRLIASTRVGWETLNVGGSGLGVKGLVYGEAHSIPSGQRVLPTLMEGDASRYPLEESLEELPEDDGYVVGAQMGVFGFGPSSHLNIFYRHAEGIAAFGETGIPWGKDIVNTAHGATDHMVAISGNWENTNMGVLAGGYWRRFKDADREDYDLDDFAEGALVLRPVYYLTDHIHSGVELGYQKHYPFGLDPSGEKHQVSEVWQFSVIEVISQGRGSYTRPNIRFCYTLSLSNEAARARYPEDDRRRPGSVEHFFSIGAEWWFNSSTY